MEKNKSIVQIILLTALVASAGLLGMKMPIVALTYPIILSFIGLKQGMIKNIMSFIISIAIIGFVSMDMNYLIIPLQYGILSMVTVYMIDRKYEAGRIVISCATLVFAMVLIHMGLRWHFTGINTLVELEESLTIVTTEQLKALKSENINEEDISTFINIMKSVKNYIVGIAPVLLMISSMAIAYINYYISSRLAKSYGRVDIETPKFSKIIMPTHVIMGFGTILILSYLLKNTEYFNHNLLLDNIYVLIFVTFLIEGISLATYLIKNLNLGRFFKSLLIIIMILSSFLNIVLFSIGIMDIVLDFRKLRKKEV